MSAQQPQLGQRLLQARRQAGLSQTELAGESWSPSYISLIEAGKRTPSPDVLRDLAERVGSDPEWLATGVGAKDLVQVRMDFAFAQLSLVEGEAAAAASKLRDLLELSSVTSHPDLSWRVRLELATAEEKLGNIVTASQLLEQLQREAQTVGEIPRLPVATALSRCLRESGDLDRAVDVARQAVNDAEALGLSQAQGYAELVSTLAGAYSERGDLTSAALILDRLIEDAAARGDQADQAYGYWNAAITAAERGQRQDALWLVERAAALLAEHNDDRGHARLKLTRAWVLLAQEPAEATRARALLREALPMLRKSASRADVASAETELGRCELLLGRPAVAQRHAHKALSMLNDGHLLERARAHTVLGSALFAGGEAPAAHLELAAAAEELEQTTARRQAATVWQLLADTYATVGDNAAAMTALRRALSCAGVVQEALNQDNDVHVQGRSQKGSHR